MATEQGSVVNSSDEGSFQLTRPHLSFLTAREATRQLLGQFRGVVLEVVSGIASSNLPNKLVKTKL